MVFQDQKKNLQRSTNPFFGSQMMRRNGLIMLMKFAFHIKARNV